MTDDPTRLLDAEPARRPPSGFPRWAVIAAASVAFLLAGGGAFAAGLATGAPAPQPTGTPTARPVPASPAPPAHIASCSIDGLASDAGLGTLSAAVIGADADPLFARGADEQVSSAGTFKLITAATAVGVLGPTTRIATTVVDGTDPGTIYLIARGDPTLSARPSGSESVYVGAAKIGDLATQAAKAYHAAHPDTPISRVVVDASYWTSTDKWNPDWKQSERTTGTVAQVVPFMVDGARADATKVVSPRNADPVAQAAAAFAAALKTAGAAITPTAAPTPPPTPAATDSPEPTETPAPPAPPTPVVADDLEVSMGAAPSGLTKLGEVRSQPVSTLVSQMLVLGDNQLAEHLARLAARKAGLGGTADAARQVLEGEFGTLGLDSRTATVSDASGLSASTTVAPATMAAIVAQLRAGADGLDVVRTGLSIGGQSGALAGRFAGDAATLAGEFVGIPGQLSRVQGLVGYFEAGDGTPVAVALYAVGDGLDQDGAKAALDALAAGVRACGSNLVGG